ncbi:MAG: hypothetical protein A3C02_02105 [Candidatus Andersenbacteria bacterium RIFCSPHIGHO2_02_FULL_45_11]|uniref:Glycosyltransferase subfamily 4-like N-terminal domain-containing protein n=1 Tax=Candidatus Andersenbacteria bacterium RIFCSPHIGHO2_12_FULL_45_11 TaxID=1797281 RepID=A0A1G1X4I4_9BACT|nr:MAG: hypothetical protein A2805_03245 [Candidatus Andersenbacteria bacterium RIFCSPHIGHO2_01_FULL_46_36]OGY34885.1 MAG: hypothetical protein A3C02_02105 [Candidatus Andersenbacteria bacterium RIFCSPHIGHO2_02_FULL_45_11]OGY34918.1 MAG: hypothetical protein A3D99_03545 [Candidatus Andersenbacteria bacterium RIFCSPHIGHO2_12_FULL_45_11]
MHIYYIGQEAVRAAALAKQATKNGHAVTISMPNTQKSVESLDFTGIRLLSLPSLDPRIPGGYLYTLLSCIAAFFIRPDTIVVQDWKAALLIRPFLLLLQKTCAVWIIDDMPPRFAARIAAGFDQICATSRTVQYRLLTQYNVTSTYIPDGYTAPGLADISPRAAGLTKEKYAVALTQDKKEIQRIARAFAAAKTRKKLVAFGAGKSSAKITYTDAPLTSRLATSIVRQAGIVIAADPAQSPLILQAMDAGRQIIATTDSLHEELLGVTANYYVSTDYKQLTVLIKAGFTSVSTNRSAIVRAKHFTWTKIGQEYERAYKHKKAVLVPFDSIVRKTSFKIAA